MIHGRWLGLPPGHRGQQTRIASFGLVTALVMLCAGVGLGALFSYQAGVAARQATEISDAFEEARYSVGAEESLERKYRLEPSPAVRQRHQQAAAALVTSLRRAQGLGAVIPADEDVSARHADYLLAIDRMFAAVDAGDVGLTNKIDAEQVDPLFDAIEAQVVATAARYRAAAISNLNTLAETQRNFLIAIPIVFVPALGLVAFFWLLLERYRLQVTNGLLREAAAVRSSELRLRALVQHTSDVILIASPAGIISYQSPTAETTWGYASRALIDTPLSDLVQPADQPALHNLWRQVLGTPAATRGIELQLRTADGNWRYIDLIVTNLVAEASIAGLVATARDITERRAFEQQLTHQAFYDSLTRLPNRVLFHDRLNQALSRVGRDHDMVGLLFLDLDNFKQINDSLGHQVGDRLLAEAAARLRDCVHEESTIARLGGDEFVILLEHVSAEADATLVAARINQLFTQPFLLDGHEFVVTASIGVALSRTREERADHMLRDADIAMYRAKAAGRANYVVFDTTMQANIVARIEMENDLRRAIKQGELRLHYQPVMALREGQIAEVEALVRWQHPVRGLILPAEFIPLAEDTGLIVPLGQWVLEAACRQVVEWQAAYPMHPPLTVSVNLSPRQFQQQGLPDEVRQVLQETGLPPTSLKLEITEGVLMRDVEATLSSLWELKELGIQLAVDDFGTGYSSLTYLKRLPLDVLKIDQSFVSGIGEDREDTAIVRAIIAMAKSLNLSITAEGIETAEQSALLQAWACDHGQGYFFARPLDATTLTTLLETGGRPWSHAEVTAPGG